MKSLMLSKSAVCPSLCSAVTSVKNAWTASGSEEGIESVTELLAVDRGEAKLLSDGSGETCDDFEMKRRF